MTATRLPALAVPFKSSAYVTTFTREELTGRGMFLGVTPVAMTTASYPINSVTFASVPSRTLTPFS
jgi:hypothetical protein